MTDGSGAGERGAGMMAGSVTRRDHAGSGGVGGPSLAGAARGE
jgi:hypothetical protein